MKIKDNIGEEEWRKFATGNDACCVFHSLEWDRLLRKEYGFDVKRVFEVDDDGKVFAGGQFCVLKERLVGLPFSDYYSLVKNERKDVHKLHELDELRELKERIASDLEQKIILGKEQKDFPTEGTEKRQILEKEQKDFSTEGTEKSNYESGMLKYLIEGGKYKEVVVKSFVGDERFVKRQEGVVHFGSLERDFDEVSKRFAEMHKRGVKKAVKAGLGVKIDRSFEGVKKFYDLHLMTRKRQGVPVQPFSFFRNLFDEVIDKGLGFVGLVYKDDVVVSGGVFLYFNKTFTYKFGASDTRFLDLRPNNLLFFEMIKYAVENGFRVFDFGKTDSKNEGLRKFKSGWGAEEKPLYYSYYPDYKESKLFEFAKDRIVAPVIRHSPKFVCRLIGEAFYKYSV